MSFIIKYINSFLSSKSPEYGFENYKKSPILLTIEDSKKKFHMDEILFEKHRKEYEYKNEQDFAVLLGSDNNGLILMDFDTNKEGQIDGAVWFEEKFGPILDNFGLVTRTPSGGYHAFFKLSDDNKDLESSISIHLQDNTSELNYKKIALDILSTENIAFQGRYYPVIQNKEIKELPIKVKEFFKDMKYVSYGTLFRHGFYENWSDYSLPKVVNTLFDIPPDMVDAN